jgi:TolB-like protein/DNA-binding winged helix-turn-helix (wHTH) protein/Flp pilus assembly protein TadD
VVSHVVHFGVFEADLRSGELRKHGLKVKIQEQPFRVLAMLLEQPGHIVTREELRKKLWPADTFVDFEHGLNAAINKLRGALGDPSDNPRFIETLHRRGYRFIAPVEAHHPPAPSSEWRRAIIDSPPELAGSQSASSSPPGFAGSQSALSSPPRSGGGQGVVEAVQAGAGLAVPATAQQAESLREAVGSAVGAVREPPRRKRWTLAAMVGVPVTLLVALFVLNVAGLRDRLLRRAQTVPKIESIAVLPLENLSHDPEQEYFADGMTEELITNLGKVSALRVISRTSVMRYKGTKKPLPEIARELNVDAVVEGTVWRSGNRVRITANLLHAPTDRHLWSESYERDLRDVLALQDDVARAIAGAITVKLTPQEMTRLASARQVNPQAYEAYLKGMYHWYKLTPADLDAALQYFDLALEKDPNSARAYAGISLVWGGRTQMGFVAPKEVTPKAKAAALKAVELDDAVAEAHSALASILTWHEWDWAGAEVEFKKAIEINPNYPDARALYSNYLMYMKRPNEAMAQIQRALELDPFNAFFQAFYGLDLEMVGRNDEAIAQFRKALKTSPDLPFLRVNLALIFCNMGMDADSLAEWKARFTRDREIQEALAKGFAQSGYRGAMRRAADALAERSRRSYVSFEPVAYLYISAGEKERTLEWLERGFKARDPNLPYVGAKPIFDSLRSDPRFQALLRRMNFPP